MFVGELAAGGNTVDVVPVRTLLDEGVGAEERPVFSGGESAPPLVAWIGRSPIDFAGDAVRYVAGAGLPAFAVAPSPGARLAGSREMAADGVSIKLECPEACTASTAGTAYALRG